MREFTRIGRRVIGSDVAMLVPPVSEAAPAGTAGMHDPSSMVAGPGAVARPGRPPSGAGVPRVLRPRPLAALWRPGLRHGTRPRALSTGLLEAGVIAVAIVAFALLPLHGRLDPSSLALSVAFFVIFALAVALAPWWNGAHTVAAGPVGPAVPPDGPAEPSSLASILRAAPEAMLVIDTDGTVVEANARVEHVCGYQPHELVGQPVELLLPERMRHVARRCRAEFATRPRPLVVGCEEDVLGRRKDGAEFPVELVLGPLDTPHGVVATATIRDVTERRRFEERLAYLATHDHLTGLPNRALFVERLRAALHGECGPGPAAVCFLDIDHFKYVNDSRGHTVGDELVVEVARRIETVVRGDDVVARFGGDEFAVLCSSLRHRDDARHLARRLLAAFDRPFAVSGVDCHVSASIGIAFGEPGDDPSVLLRNADAAMYHAKQSGRSRIELFDEVLTARALARLDTETALHRALERDELFLAYQPVVDLASGRLIGAEALIRWRHPERGLVPPQDFVPIAEETGLIQPIGRWVLGEAGRQVAAWLAASPEPPEPFSMSVNVSCRQLEHDSIIGDVAGMLRETGLPPQCLVLEITESFLIRDMRAAVGRLEALKALGVRLAIDDFGTGFSSLSSLARLPIDVVKIDKSFVDGSGRRNDAVIGAIIELARAFDLEVVAEGVETKEQQHRLVELGCRWAQGYLFSEPLEPDGWEPLIAASSSA
jgi:diguanylate cyclase (GGDEF)-like protein/PAS domain S-box-containing protein